MLNSKSTKYEKINKIVFEILNCLTVYKTDNILTVSYVVRYTFFSMYLDSRWVLHVFSLNDYSNVSQTVQLCDKCASNK